VPNQRSKRKVFLGGYVEKDLKRRLVSMAKEAGMGHDRFGFVMSLISRPLAQRRKKSGLVSAKPKAALARP
jgi:hypothetical protein